MTAPQSPADVEAIPDAEVDAAARAMYVVPELQPGIGWEREAEPARERYRVLARAALTAARDARLAQVPDGLDGSQWQEVGRGTAIDSPEFAQVHDRGEVRHFVRAPTSDGERPDLDALVRETVEELCPHEADEHAEAPLDTVIFLWAAGFGVTADALAGQFLGKVLWATVVPLVLYAGVHRAVLRQPVDAEDS